MKRKNIITFSIALVFILTACVRLSTPAPTSLAPTAGPSQASGVVISEVLAGVQGNNNLEFIELYNASEEIVDLQGWTLWYRLATSEDDLLVYRWKRQALIPPHGHYLLVRAGQG